MKLGIAGTGKIVEDALYAMSPLEEVAVNAIFARPHSKAKETRSPNSMAYPQCIPIM